MWKLVKTIYFWAMFTSVTIFCFSLIFCLKLISLLTGTDQERHMHNMALMWGQLVFFFTPGWQIEILGKENLPQKNEAVIIVANHESMTDIWAMCFTKMQFRWMAKSELFRLPFIGPGMRWCGYVPVERGNKNSHSGAMKQSAEKLQHGISMLFFPEGTRSEISGQLREFKLGAFRLAHDTSKPVLPVVLRGTGNLLPKGSAYPQKAQIIMKILPKEWQGDNETAEDFAKRMRQLIIENYQALPY